jgi:hypothetical protein
VDRLTRAVQNVTLSFVHQTQRKACLINVAMPLFANAAKGLKPIGSFFLGSGGCMAKIVGSRWPACLPASARLVLATAGANHTIRLRQSCHGFGGVGVGDGQAQRIGSIRAGQAGQG